MIVFVETHANSIKLNIEKEKHLTNWKHYYSLTKIQIQQ